MTRGRVFVGLFILLVSAGLATFAQVRPVVGPDSVIDLEFTEGTDLEAVPSPDGGRLALQLWSGIWILDARGGQARQVTDPTNPADEHWYPRWSPDGRFIAYSSLRSDGGIFVVPAAGGPARRLTDTEFDFWPAWSPDAELVAFTRAQGLWMIPAGGGAARRLTPPDIDAQQPAWSPDGAWIAFSSSGHLAVMKPDGSSLRSVTDGQSDQLPSWTSDGSELLFLSERSGSVQVWRVPIGGGDARRVTDEPDVYRYAPRWVTGQQRILYTGRGAIRLVAPDGSSPRVVPFRARLRVTRQGYQRRPPTIPAAGVPLSMRGLTRPAIATSGRIVVAAGGDLWSIETDGRVEQLTSGPADDGEPAWAPSADRVAFVSNRTGDYQVWVLNLRTRATEPLTREPGHCETPLWHPSGSSIVFVHSPRPQSRGVLKVVSVADGSVRTVVETKGIDTRPIGWESRDGDLVYAELGSDAERQLRTVLRRVPLDGSAARDVLALPGQAEFVALAPGADLVAYVSNGELWVRSLRDDRPARRVSTGPAFFPAWETETRILFSSGGDLRRVDVDRMGEESLPARLTWKVPDAPGALLLRNVRVLDPEPRAGLWDVMIRDGRIASVTRAGGTGRVGSADQTIDLNGRTLMPGLMDLHAHMFRGFPAEGYLYWGVTSVGGAGEEGNWVVQQQQAIDGGTRAGPRIFPAGGFVVPPFMNAFPQFLRVANQQQLDRYADYLVRLGATQVKSYLRRDPWLEAATTRAAHERGLPVLSHFLRPAAVEAGLDRKEHAFFYAGDGSAGLRFRQDVLEILRKTGITLAPTLVFAFVQTEEGRRRAESELSRPDVSAMLVPSMLAFLKTQMARPRTGPESARFQNMLEAGSANVAAARAAGVPLVVGTDYAPLGFLGVHWELELFVAAGLTPTEAIAAATRNAARTLGVADDLGSVRVGALADLIVLDADPLQDIRHTQRIHLVIKGGRIVDRDALLRSLPGARGNQPPNALHPAGAATAGAGG